MKLKKESLLLYAITDSIFRRKDKLENQVEKAILGGATIVQYREKELKFKEMITEAENIKVICKKYNVPFIVNDNVDLAIEIDADGIHLGQDDISVKEARLKLGANKIIGATAKTIKQALIAQEEKADYIGSGAVFPSITKKQALQLDLQTIKQICENVQIPVVAIGGINCENILHLKNLGISGVAVVGGIFATENIEASARELKKKAELMQRSNYENSINNCRK